MTHWTENYYTVGRCRTGSTQVTETRMKSAVKTKAKNTNNQASFGMSLLKHNQNVEAAMELSRHLDEKGVHLVWTGLAAFFFLFAICLDLCRTNMPCLDSLVEVHTLFGLCLA